METCVHTSWSKRRGLKSSLYFVICSKLHTAMTEAELKPTWAEILQILFFKYLRLWNEDRLHSRLRSGSSKMLTNRCVFIHYLSYVFCNIFIFFQVFFSNCEQGISRDSPYEFLIKNWWFNILTMTISTIVNRNSSVHILFSHSDISKGLSSRPFKKRSTAMLYNIFSVNHAEFKQILTQKSWKIGVKTIIKRLHTTLDLPSIIEENKWCFNQHWTSKKGEMSIEYWKIKIISGTTKYTGCLYMEVWPL